MTVLYNYVWLFYGINAVAGNHTLQACMFTNQYEKSSTFDFSKGGAAVDLALEYVRDNVLPDDVSLEMVIQDLGPQCGTDSHVTSYAMDYFYRGLNCNVYIGPGCRLDVETLYDVADYFRIPLIAITGAGVGAGTDLALYPSLARISVTHTNTFAVLARFWQRFNYTHVGMVCNDADRFYQDMFLVIRGEIMKWEDFEKRSAVMFRTFDGAAAKGDQVIEAVLSDLKNFCRVFVILASGDTLRRVMIIARRLGLTSVEFIYLAVELFPSATWGAFTWERHDNNDIAARDAYSSLLLFSYEPVNLVTRETFENKVKKLSPKYGYTYKPREAVEETVGHFYDAVLLYASLVSQRYELGHDVADSELIFNLLGNYSFVSPVSGIVQLDINGDRVIPYIAKRFIASTGRFEPFLEFPNTNEEVVVVDVIDWKGAASLPRNTPRCGFRGENPACQPVTVWTDSTIIATALVPVIFLVLLGVGVFFGGKRYLDTHYDPYWWRVFSHQLLPPSTGTSMGSNTSATKFANASGSKRQPTGTGTAATSQFSGPKSRSLAMDSLYPTCNKIYVFQGNAIGASELPKPFKRAVADMGVSLRPLRRMQHRNVQTFSGIEVNEDNFCVSVLGELCQKGDLELLLQSKTVRLDDSFKFTIMLNLASGVNFLHNSPVISHGFLMESTCLVDGRFVVKLAGHGLTAFHHDYELREPQADMEEIDKLTVYLWRAPEFLRRPMPPKGSVKGDIYSMAVLFHQIVVQKGPFGNPSSDEWTVSDVKILKDVLNEVKRAAPPLRPRLPRSACPTFLVDLIEQCWSEDPVERPTAWRVLDTIRYETGYTTDNVTDHLIKRLETYAATLEYQVEARTKVFMEEKRRGEELLSTILPRVVAQALNSGKEVQPEMFASTSVFFSRLEGYEEVIRKTQVPVAATHILNHLYVTCDKIIERYDVYKVETVADAYMIVSGLPVPNGSRHADIIASMSLHLSKQINGMTFQGYPEMPCHIRIGINSGPCAAGIIGLKLPRYCLYGDTVNTASRMESSGQAGRIHISASTRDLLLIDERYEITERGATNIKGKGMLLTFWLNGLSTKSDELPKGIRTTEPAKFN
ncbi:atrial natriuretic peptide receptor 1-like [Paramacrobiotus metropolitanus]|uniref:atrial natriuretic peptide receptor 1-like n=1 Tax=Paramacrobiotus metropolitanus TaxID=2943436 RepID=UPI0024464A24|nr:atrial natriuretic peptide receptor 1-like [Paramacrobiotus metropolitanus]